MIHYIGRERRLNCWLLVLGLAVRGRLSGVKLYWRGLGWPHPVGRTRRGKMIHFKRTRGRVSRFGAWFYGRVQIYPGWVKP
jgi:hypothetical protein